MSLHSGQIGHLKLFRFLDAESRLRGASTFNCDASRASESGGRGWQLLLPVGTRVGCAVDRWLTDS